MSKRLTTKQCGESSNFCPYSTLISLYKDDIQMIKNALIGQDMKGGIVADLAELKQVNAVNRSWNNVIKPILIAAISGMVVWVLTRL